MDIRLERILSLIPRKPNGQYVYGEKTKFAASLGYDSGDIISMWEKGTSQSWEGKIYEISAKYGVSVEWLRGETDIKEKTAPTDGSGLNPDYFNLTPENQALVDSMIEKLLMSQSND